MNEKANTIDYYSLLALLFFIQAAKQVAATEAAHHTNHSLSQSKHSSITSYTQHTFDIRQQLALLVDGVLVIIFLKITLVGAVIILKT